MSDHAAASAPRGLILLTLMAMIAFGLTSMTICLPSMHEWRATFGRPQAEIQLTFGAFVVFYGISQVIYGPLSDRYGRRPIVITGFVIALAGSLLAAAADSLPMLIAARLVQGSGAAAGMVIGRAMVQDFFGGTDRARVMAYIGMVMGMSPPLATIIGGQVHVALGWRANFVLVAALAALILVLIGLCLPRDARKPAGDSHWLRHLFEAYGQLAQLPVYLCYAGIVAMSTATFYVFLTGLPLVLAGYDVGPERVGYYIMLIPTAYIVGNFFTARLLVRFSERGLMLTGQITTLSSAALVLVLAKIGVLSPLAVALPLVLLGLGHGLLMPSALAGTVSVMPALAGAAAGATGLGQQMLGALGGFAVGLVPHDSAANFALLLLACTLVSLFGHVLLGRFKNASI